MRDRVNLLAWALLMLLSLYNAFLSLAAMLDPRFKTVALALGALTLAAWGVGRWRGKWRWHSTPLDGIAALWLAVIALSTLANLETWRRSAIGIWHVGLYIGTWLVLWDCMANRALPRSAVADSLLISTLIPITFALGEVSAFIADFLRQLSEGFALPPPVRPVGTLGNTNMLAICLALVIPLGIGRLLSVRLRWQRLALALYLALALILLGFTFSRSAWFGAIVGLVLLGALWLRHNQLGLGDVWQWLRERKLRLGVAALATIGLLGIAFLTLRTLDDPSRALGLRTYLYEAAWQTFQEQPLFGSGLFTFGSQLFRFASIPPDQTHAHAHNAPLNIAAELGVLGILALLISVGVVIRSFAAQWRTWTGAERLLVIGAAASLGTLAASNLTDFTLMTVTIALRALVVFAVALFPARSTPLPPSRSRLAVRVVLGLWIGLYLSGVWSLSADNAHLTALQRAVRDEDWRASLPYFERAIALDPQLSLYHLYYGQVLGVAASEGEATLQAALAAYETFVRQEPNYPAAWANLAALHWQAGNSEAALSAMRRAVDLAPRAWLFYYALGTYYEALGDQMAARRAYAQALSAAPAAALYPAWRETPLRRQIAESIEIPPSIDAVTRLLRNGDLSAAEALWQRVRWNERAALIFLVDAVLAFERGDLTQAERACQQVERIPPDEAAGESWRWLCRAYLAHIQGNSDAYATAREVLASYRQKPFVSPMDIFIAPIGATLFQRVSLLQYLLPQVYNPPLPPSFYAIYDHLNAFVAR